MYPAYANLRNQIRGQLYGGLRDTASVPGSLGTFAGLLLGVAVVWVGFKIFAKK